MSDCTRFRISMLSVAFPRSVRQVVYMASEINFGSIHASDET